ncbi:predicted protein [Histoplasma capsulatum G186AR]|uniref:Uncharacterized protein n=1 Tax=Ajellomyces capsulatus (strain G186AR / H82 / ATCC MYA-2454 / RMSCC 2432) TaxID=447093 RepID=C0NGM2_AJECG|nr:uncharacterized protein HCBG_02494 [Histoplasma capsulatum G186AR]EEH08957.1 predicted protein [Histoplasma capsulatum G186AR]
MLVEEALTGTRPLTVPCPKTQSNHCTHPTKTALIRCQLSDEQLDEIEQLITASKVNHQMSYKELIVVLHLEINENCPGEKKEKESEDEGRTRGFLLKKDWNGRISEIVLWWSVVWKSAGGYAIVGVELQGENFHGRAWSRDRRC